MQCIDLIPIERNPYHCDIDIIFTANDPLAYDNTPTTDSQTITVNGTQYVVANGGNHEAYPTITLTFNDAQTHIYIHNLSVTDNRLDIAKEFEAADILEINCKDSIIKLNSSNSPAGLGEGGSALAEMIMLTIGDNTLEVGSDDATINVDVDISFNKPYLY